MKPDKTLMKAIKESFKPEPISINSLGEPYSLRRVAKSSPIGTVGFSGGLKTLSDPTRLPKHLEEKKSALKDAIYSFKTGTFSYKETTTTSPGWGTGIIPEIDYKTAVADYYKTLGVTVIGSEPNFAASLRNTRVDRVDTGKCTIPGCTVNGKKYKDYEDKKSFICEKHYGVYKENNKE